MFLYLPSTNSLRLEHSNEIISTLLRKGWQELSDPEVEGSTWDGSQWVAPLPPPITPDYTSFYFAFLNSSTYQTAFLPLIDRPGYEVEGKVITQVGFALHDAMAGRVPLPESPDQPNSLQAALWLLLMKLYPQLTLENLDELQELFDQHNLSPFYVFFPPGYDPALITVPRWVEFGIALGSNAMLNAWYHALFTPQTSVLHGMITVGLGQAAEGNPKTFLAAWGQALAAELVPEQLITEVVAAATSFNLPADFIAALSSLPLPTE